MTTRTRILLFDLDGVLVNPLGYRAALRASVNHFRAAWGWQPDDLPEEEIALFEAHGITSEWDMLPLILASQLQQTALEGARLPSELPTGAEGGLPAPKNRAALRETLATLQNGIHPGEHPAQAALRLNLFTRLPRPLQNNLLANTRHVQHSQTTRVFQHFVLGDSGYAQTYARPAEFRSPSLLREEDQPLLSTEWRAHLIAARAAQKLSYVALTARPSLPPRGIPSLGFSPEAELALACIGLPDMPLIGYGRLQYLAQQAGGEAEQFLKPSPVQALAAILAALGDPEDRALWHALTIQREKRLNHHRLAASGDYEIVVFEDSPGGIRAGLNAVTLLRELGVAAHFQGYGITTNPDKQRVLENLGAQVFPEVNDALRNALD